MRTHIVYAHPSDTSLNASLRDETTRHLESLGHTVTVSDLYAMKWKATADYDDFGAAQSENFIAAAGEAYESGSQSDDITEEQRKLLAVDNLILQFPLWWFSMPAIMKGWVDRVFTNGFGYGTTRTWPRYGNGMLEGKRAMIAVTTGAGQPHLSDRGVNGSIEDLLFPINHGILFYAGMHVLPAFVVNGAVQLDEDGYAAAIEALRGRLDTLAETEPIAYRKQNGRDYDENVRLKPGLERPGSAGFGLHIA
ncbi:NAD(P)H-dependent oxidoreductase [Glycomyces buryatensis]|uniref:NAD(P)H-dependent oxidoreductase n=1 Tax=Glycomyces buryatensis TaxID=2570927 RepID=A0A4S8PZN4_9ACTN|nr:NAD(P)H-dependent oxidoreductase [Glycomyces buryatensis]THV37130.1 NAD(P)H-dependent oxidoreductase [Glycomyces buryatensis]